MNGRLLALMGVCLFFLISCSKTSSSNAPHASVTLRDGKVSQGVVQSTSATQVQLQGDDGVTQTIPMDHVRSIDYGATAAAPASTAPAAPGPASVAPPPSPG